MSTPTPVQLFTGVADVGGDELFTVLAASEAVRIERIVSPPGHATPPDEWYDQDREEWVLVVAGRAALDIDPGDGGATVRVELGPGDHLVLPAHRRHRVAWTAADATTVWLAVHYQS